MVFLHLKEVSRRFGGLKALSRVSLEVNQGEILGIIGPNGAGKTTLFNTLTGFLRPDDGEIHLAGESIVGLRPHEICAKGMARTFQIVKPFLQLTVLDNTVVGALNQARSVPEALEKARKILEFVGLAGRQETLAAELTLPGRKRLELARALATGPKILLLDEVMAGLNATETDEMISLLRTVNQWGITILLIEHVMRGVMALSQRVAVLNYGEKIAEGPPGEVIRDPLVVEAYLGEEFLLAQG